MNVPKALQKWDLRYQNATQSNEPLLVLQKNSHLLPKQGVALDLACGLGGNAIFLAKHGLKVHAWDNSAVAIKKCREYSHNLDIDTEVRDVIQKPPPPQAFDVIVVGYFLERSLADAITAALKVNGLLFYQTFSQTTNHSTIGPKNPIYRLADNELLALFAKLNIRYYQEALTFGDSNVDAQDQVSLVAEKIFH